MTFEYQPEVRAWVKQTYGLCFLPFVPAGRAVSMMDDETAKFIDPVQLDVIGNGTHVSPHATPPVATGVPNFH